MLIILSLLNTLPSIQDTIHPQEYLVAGPFLLGVRESGWRNLPDEDDYKPREGDSLFSVLATGGWVYWEEVEVDSTGWLQTEYPNVEWDFLQDRYGITGLYNSGYAYVKVRVKERSRALVVAQKCSFSINDRGYAGDSYGHGIVQVPVILEKGVNKIWVRLGGAGDDRVYFRLIPVDHDVRLIVKDATLPDLLYGRDNSGPLYGAIPVSNTVEDWFAEARLIVGGGDFYLDTFDLPPIAPMSFYKAPFTFELSAPLPDSVPDNKLDLPISIVWEDGKVDYLLNVDCKHPTQPHEQTFISAIDSSVQYYGIIEPADFDSTEDYTLILALHGAGSKGIWHLGQYQGNDWAFMVGPTNRRRYGFDWQDWGRLDCLEVYDLIMERYPIDPDRVCLTGHSMGGHGTWHVGLTHPDLFCCAAPGAGWTNHEYYVPWTWQKSGMFAEPCQLAVRNHALRTDNQLARVENALNLPFYIYQGGADDNVPAFQARLYGKRLNQLGYDHVYHEYPGGGHGWNEVISGDTFSCIATPEIIEFFQDAKRDPYPNEVYYRTADLSANNGAYWLSIHTIADRYQDAVIQGSYQGRTIEVTTDNVTRFALELPGKVRDISLTIKIDDSETTLPVTPADSVTFELTDAGWQQATSLNYSPSHPPIKGAYYEPFILVFGTRGDDEETDRLYAMARSEAQAWWYRANGTVRIVPDSLVDADLINCYNLILFGNADQNAVTARIEAGLPVRIQEGRFVFNDEIMPPGADAALFVYPNPLNPHKKVLVREGIGEEGLGRSGYFSTLYSGAGLPDYIIWGAEVADKGWGGVIEAGFFTAEWEY
jgi:dienelactone hydrolase